MQKYKRIQDIFKAYIHNMRHIKIYIYNYLTFYYYHNSPEIIYYHQTINRLQNSNSQLNQLSFCQIVINKNIYSLYINQ